jgi:UDP-glucose:(heptosyl)LPS alpha-1,3-glucosyltransferase
MKNRVELGVKKKTIRRIEILLYFLEYNFKKGNHIKTVATSNQVKKELIKYIKTPENNIAFIPNGVDVIKFQPDNIVRYRNIMRNELQINEKDFVFLFIGNDPRRKGLLTVLDAFTGIPEQDASLVIVGEDLNDPEAFEFYKRRAAGTEKKSKIRFLPIRDDIERLFAAADAFVFPSLYESFGLVVLEAMASGIPVAASRTGAFEDIIENGVNGFLVNDPLDVKELSVLMSEMKNSPEKLKKISVMGRKQALNYSWENIAVQTLKLYEEILSVNVSRGS